MSATEDYINVLTHLKTGELGLLRTHAGQDIDESLEGFDLFSGLWWPLRQKSERAPRREVAWLIAKLYAFTPIPQSTNKTFETLAHQLRRCQPNGWQAIERYQQRFDRMLQLPINDLETVLQWALSQISVNKLDLDWVKLTDDLSIWDRESTRQKWAEQYLNL